MEGGEAAGGPGRPLSDAELAALAKEELVRRLRQEEAEKLAALVQRGRLMQEVNRQLQGHLGEIRELKQVNRRLQDENRELRDLCCFLDHERQKGRRVAREWQLFGAHASRAVRDELAGCWQKLAQLEGRQDELLRENLALKELCLALEEEWGPRPAAGAGAGAGAGAAAAAAAGGGAAAAAAAAAAGAEAGAEPGGGPGGSGPDGPGGPGPELGLPPCGARDVGDGSSSTGSVGSPDQLHLACSPDD
ncbi:coiled-coil domain-containing protein 85B [Dromiciops gliroides]|uniref:coiled-coil domain-containing protein 85B n=1 Tax=Dromiciops gliroides TaxID=33562 RepID=UPI001CC3D6F5|nr:coiled-coil domain-containing protein 85B [Dromiciops gliroides]